MPHYVMYMYIGAYGNTHLIEACCACQNTYLSVQEVVDYENISTISLILDCGYTSLSTQDFPTLLGGRGGVAG